RRRRGTGESARPEAAPRATRARSRPRTRRGSRRASGPAAAAVPRSDRPADPLPGPAEAGVEPVLRAPPELPLGERRVEGAPLQLAEARRRALGLLVGLGDAGDPVVELEDGRLAPRADVEDAAVVADRREGRPHDVG